MIQVADFFGDGAVAVEKNGGTKKCGVRQDAPPEARARMLPRLRRRRE
jgi:hypothetical protein